MILAVSFDVWNTLLNTDVLFRRLAKLVSVMRGLDPVEVEAIIYETYKKVRELRLFIVNSDEVRVFPMRSRHLLAKMLNIDFEELVKAIDAIFASLDIDSILFKDVKPTLDVLSSLNLKLGVIGNTAFWESIYTRELLDRSGIKEYLNVQLYSDEVGIFKPDKRIFLEFCKRLNVKPQEVLHIGDSVIEDVGGSLSSGMKVMMINRAGNARKVIVPEVGLMITHSLSDAIEAIQVLD
ncbi:MAG: HAD family hydrolase [Ignisphaera sp.]|uniref:HAD family hydrolase n=1 Tax=Ignisphaera aggregans TaxID=334771 RepID=A0A7C4NNM6_9CREN